MVFIDARVVKVRDGQVANRPVYVAIGVTVNGERDISAQEFHHLQDWAPQQLVIATGPNSLPR